MSENQEKPALAVAARTNTMGAIVPRDVEQVWRYATIVANAGYAPKSYENDEAKIATAIMHGAEVGLLPMQAIQGIAVINGMPTIWGDAALGLVEASGLLENIEETVEYTDDNGELPISAKCRVKRRGRNGWTTHLWTMAQASKAGLTGKDPWKKYPQRMLQMRARSWALRDAFPDVLKGLAIRDEIQDFVDAKPDDDGTYRVEDAPAERPKKPHQMGTRPTVPEPQTSAEDVAFTAEQEAEANKPDPDSGFYAWTYMDHNGQEWASTADATTALNSVTKALEVASVEMPDAIPDIWESAQEIIADAEPPAGHPIWAFDPEPVEMVTAVKAKPASPPNYEIAIEKDDEGNQRMMLWYNAFVAKIAGAQGPEQIDMMVTHNERGLQALKTFAPAMLDNANDAIANARKAFSALDGG